MLLLNVIYSSAQRRKIAIFSQIDTTVVHQHQGLTIFTNFTDTLYLNFPIKQYVEEQLKKYLSHKYDVTIIKELPDSLSPSEGLYAKLGGFRKEVKEWLTVLKNQYDIIIFTDNISVSFETNTIIPDHTNGLFSRGGYLGYYTTIAFTPYRTSNFQRIEYYYFGGKFMTQVKDFKLPKDKRNFTPEILQIIKDGFIKHLDSRIEYFLASAYLVPKDQIEGIKNNSK